MINGSCRWLVVTDLDGTLLDHDSYSVDPARPALARLHALGIPLILNSSKTLAELQVLRAALNCPHPVIAENGAVIDIPTGYFPDPSPPTPPTLERTDLINTLHDLRRHYGYHFQGFADWSIHQIATHTGLTDAQAALAAQRQASEPLLWLDTDEKLGEFTKRLAAHRYTTVQGGRFLHVLPGTDKADALAQLKARYSVMWGATPQVIALGDSPNDASMLNAADIAVVIASSRSAQLQPRAPRVLRSNAAGPEGWRDCMNTLLDELDT